MDDTGGKSVSAAEDESGATLALAQALFDQREHRQAFEAARRFWLNHPLDRRAPELLAKIAAEAGSDKLNENLSRLARPDDTLDSDPQALFETGYQLIDERLFDLAAMLLSRAAAIKPGEPVINYELGFCLMALKRFSEAIEPFERALTTGDLDCHLNLSVCHTMARDVEKARQHLSALADLSGTADFETDQEKQELSRELDHRSRVLARLESLQQKTSLTHRDWYYVLYGGLLLEGQSKAAAVTLPDHQGSAFKTVAENLLALKGVMEALGLEVDMVEYCSLAARPIAESLGRLFDVAVERFSNEAGFGRSLLVAAWAQDLIRSFKLLTGNDGKRLIFCYAVSPDEPAPVAPELVSLLAPVCPLPWYDPAEEGKRQSADRLDAHLLPDEVQAAHLDNIMQRMSEVESNPDLIKHVQELSDYFLPKRALLALGGQQGALPRPAYTAEIPVP